MVRPASSYRSLVNPRALSTGDVTLKSAAWSNKLLASILTGRCFVARAAQPYLFRLLLQLPLKLCRQRARDLVFCRLKIPLIGMV